MQKESGAHFKREGSGARTMTKYRPLAHAKGYTLLEIQLITGKTHQIRAHMQAIGHPLQVTENTARKRQIENSERNMPFPISSYMPFGWNGRNRRVLWAIFTERK